MAEQERHILYKVKPALAGDQVADAVDIENDATGHTGLLANAGNQQVINDRLDSTGLGAQPRTFTGSFFASYGALGNQDQWYGGQQSVTLIGAAGQANGRRTFELPDITELGLMFDDLQSRGLGQIFTITIGYLGGTTASVVQNSLTIRPPSVSASFDSNQLPVTIAQGASATFRIERVGGVIGRWERLGVQQATAPVAVLGDVIIQSAGWNNADGSFLPNAAVVQQGYAFRVVNSSPNDGTLRQGLLDAGVSDRLIYDGDYVIWTAATFTSWTNGDDWFVLNRDSLQRMSREESNFLAQTTEVDNRVDLMPVAMATNDALVWLSENPLAEAPFLTPSTDPSNPRSGDDYPYVGGRENRNGQMQFELSQNRFNNYLTIGITPSFILAHPESDIDIVHRDIDGTILERLNLATDFTFVDDATFTNNTVRHYTRATSFNYSFLTTVEIWLTQVQEHFTINPDTVDVTQNVRDLPEFRLSTDVQEKLNRALPDPGVSYADIEDRLMRYTNISQRSAATDARFYSDDGTGAYPSDLSLSTQVSAANPRFQATGVVLFVAVPEPGVFVLMNTSQDTQIPLDQSEPTVDVVESFTVSGVSYFVYRVTGITIGNRFEVDRLTLEQVIQERNDIANLQDDVQRIDAELSHAVLDLPAEVVDVLDNEVTVTEESTPSIDSTAYNASLGDTAAQTVFLEPSPNAPSAGSRTSRPMNELTGDRARRKLIYFPAAATFGNGAVLHGFDGSTARDLIRYQDGVFNARVRVPAIPASTTTSVIYPAPANRVSGAGIWINIPALTFVNGVPVPEADEVFFTRDIPAAATTLNIQYRGHANGNIFGAGTTTLAGVGGATDAFTTVTLNDGSEQVFLEIRWYASRRQIRASITERVNAGLPTVNDVEVILSYDETRTVPATNASTRNVAIESLHDGVQVFAIRPSATDTIILVGDQTEIDTGWAYTTVFGAGETGHLAAFNNNTSVAPDFFDYEDFDPIASTVTDLENHASLPQYGLFTTKYTHETIVNLATQLTVLDDTGAVQSVGAVLRDLLARVTALEP